MAGNNKKRKQHISFVLRAVAAAAALYLAFGNQNLKELKNQLLEIDIWLFAVVVGLFIVAQVLFVLRWCMLLRVLSIHIGLMTGLKLHFLGLFYNNCLPSAIGGDLLRAWYVTKHVEDNKRVEAVLSVFFDRVVGLAGMLLMAAIFYWLIPVEGNITEQQASSGTSRIPGLLIKYKWVLIASVVLLAVISAFIIVLASKRSQSLPIKFLRRLWGITIRLSREGLAAVKLYIRRPFVIVYAIGLTFALQAICIIGFWFLGLNMGMETHIKYYFVLFPVSWLLGAIPISIGGIGVVEGWLRVMFLQLPGVIEAQASALAVCQRLIWLVASLPGVIIHLFGAHLPKDFSIDYDELIT